MSSLYKVAFVGLMITFSSASAQNSAGEYLSFIGTQYQEISKDMMSYSSAVAHGKGARKVEKKRNELIQQLRESERNVRKMKPFNNDSKLRDSIASYFRKCQLMLNEDYGKIINLEDIAEQSYDAMEAYLLAKEKANEKLGEANERVRSQYSSFAANNNIKLIDGDSKLSQKIAAASKVGNYHDVVYLIFFKSFKNEAYFLDALSKGDVNAMEQSKNSLETSVTADLSKLGTVQAFEGDGTLKNSCQQMLNFYKKEATASFPVLIEFQLKKENFEKMKKAIEANKNSTKEQIDAFNKSVDEYNVWVKKANAANDECNKGRNQFLTKWYDSSDKFLDTHTPTYR